MACAASWAGSASWAVGVGGWVHHRLREQRAEPTGDLGRAGGCSDVHGEKPRERVGPSRVHFLSRVPNLLHLMHFLRFFKQVLLSHNLVALWTQEMDVVFYILLHAFSTAIQ